MPNEKHSSHSREHISIPILNIYPMDVRIEKIWWENSASMRETISLIKKNQTNGIKSIYVFSAFRTSEYNTTTELLKCVEACTANDEAQARVILDRIASFYRETISKEWYDTPGIEWVVNDIFGTYRAYIRAYFADTHRIPPEESNDYAIWGVSFLGAWEVITTEIYRTILFGGGDTWSIDPAQVDDYTRILSMLESTGIVVSPGYYGWLPGGIIQTWGRGYSDATAVRIYESIKEMYPAWNLTLSIRKMYPICSADPRSIDRSRVKKLSHISLGLLLEMIGTHGASSQFVNQNAANISFFEKWGILQIYTEDDPIGSIISLDWDEMSTGFLFIASKSLKVFTISSYQFNIPWYTEYLAHFFTKKGINIDNIVTSQTQISITIADKDTLKYSIESLRSELLGYLKIFETDSAISPTLSIEDHANIYIGGEDIDFPGSLAQISSILREHSINITLLLQPLHPRVVIIGVKKKDEKHTLDVLHRWLIEV